MGPFVGSTQKQPKSQAIPPDADSCLFRSAPTRRYSDVNPAGRPAVPSIDSLKLRREDIQKNCEVQKGVTFGRTEDRSAVRRAPISCGSAADTCSVPPRAALDTTLARAAELPIRPKAIGGSHEGGMASTSGEAPIRGVPMTARRRQRPIRPTFCWWSKSNKTSIHGYAGTLKRVWDLNRSARPH